MYVVRLTYPQPTHFLPPHMIERCWLLHLKDSLALSNQRLLTKGLISFFWTRRLGFWTNKTMSDEARRKKRGPAAGTTYNNNKRKKDWFIACETYDQLSTKVTMREFLRSAQSGSHFSGTDSKVVRKLQWMIHNWICIEDEEEVKNLRKMSRQSSSEQGGVLEVKSI